MTTQTTYTIGASFGERDRAELVALLRAYETSLGLRLDFQSFDEELADLPGEYAPPDGALLLARHAEDKHLVGCVAMRAFDRPGGIAEMKRLYIDPSARGTGLGRQLALAAIEMAAKAGYRRLRLDTLPSMARAQELYVQLGFRDIANYNGNPLPGSRFLELILPTPK
jgi:ribosomal protein S18 acetylase RimI-like enzyme